MIKKVYLLIISIFITLFLLNYCGNNADTTVSNPASVKDDGTWAYILDNKLITKDEFEKTYTIFIKMAKIVALASGVSQGKIDLASQNIEKKRDVLERIINSEITFQKALEDPLFKGAEGKSIIENFYKQALNLYLIEKEVLSKINEPTKDEIEKFYKKYQKEFQANGVKDLNSDNNQEKVKNFYTSRKIKKEMEKFNAKLIGEKRIKYNESILENYLANKITKKQVEEDKEGKYWILNIDGNNLLLKDVIYIIDSQLKNTQIAKQISTEANRAKMAELILDGFKKAELGYRTAIDKGYDKNQEGKKFIDLVQKRSVAVYYFTNNILPKSNVKIPTLEDAKKFSSDPSNRKKVIEFFKTKKIPVTEDNIVKATYEQLYFEYLNQVNQSQAKFINRLKEAHIIRISEKFFETASDKIQKKILDK
ncbi:MAG: hypothetical protein OEV44_08160 [Spirochaetota bacterium]|nr:hypothetical protein [Spirochaetota bacterium]